MYFVKNSCYQKLYTILDLYSFDMQISENVKKKPYFLAFLSRHENFVIYDHFKKRKNFD